MKINNQINKALCCAVLFLLMVISFESYAGWFGAKEKSCQQLVNKIIDKPIILSTREEVDNARDICYQIVLKDGDYKELYAYYSLYKFADITLKKVNKGQDKTPNNIYHWMLFYANQNSREFDSKINDFKNSQGLYEQELKNFEDEMTQEEKIKSFAYIADNLAAGKEGWVKKHDYQKSFEYLKKAAEAGDVGSQSSLGASYFLGTDWMNRFEISKDYVGGYKWMYVATMHSTQIIYEHKLHIASLNRMKNMMNVTQLKQAKEEATIWINQNDAFIKNHPLKLIKMTQEEVKQEQKKTRNFIKDNNLDQPLKGTHFLNKHHPSNSSANSVS